MLKIWIREYDCHGESTPCGGVSFEVADETELETALSDLEERYAGGIVRVFPRFEIEENERFYKAYYCGDLYG